MNFWTANDETDPLDSAVRLLAVGVSANCARPSAQSAQAKAAHLEPGTSTPSGLIRNWHSGLDAALCDTANYYALPAPAGSAQPIAHRGVLPVDSQSPTFTVAIRQSGAACLLGDFYFQGVEGFADVGRQGLGAGMHRGRLTVPRVSATRREVHVSGRFESDNVHHFTAPPRATTLATGNYGNGWRFFYQSRRRAAAGPLPALAGNLLQP